MSKLKEIVKKSLDKTYWINSIGQFKNISEYPQEFEQKFGNISLNTISLDDYLVDIQKINETHEFFKKWGFDVVKQYKINEFKKILFYFSDHFLIRYSSDLIIFIHFSLPKKRISLLLINLSYSLKYILTPKER